VDAVTHEKEICAECHGSGLLGIRVEEGDASWHDGPGWYFIDSDYPDEGSCGAFKSKNDAIVYARESYTESCEACRGSKVIKTNG